MTTSREIIAEVGFGVSSEIQATLEFRPTGF